MKNESSFFDFSIVIKFILKWWKHFFIVCFVAALAGIIFSSPLFITPMYQAGTTMFPTTTNSISKAVLQATTREDFLQFGTIEDAERLLQVLGSGSLLGQVAEELNLMEHYGYEKDDKSSRHSFSVKFAGNVSSRRTRFGAVEVSVRDHDPEMAANIANTIAARLDSVMHQMRYGRANQAYEITSSNLKEERQRMKAYQDSLAQIMKQGVMGIESQAGMLSRQLAIDLSRNYTPGVKAIDERFEKISDVAADHIYLRAQIEHVSHNIANLERRLIDKVADLENPIQFKFVIDPASPPQTKSYPVRWIIVLLSVFGAATTCLIFLMAYEILQTKGILSQVRESIKKEIASK
jgi:uncharacterized protein involved in exopolysaccharide biosynthesis